MAKCHPHTVEVAGSNPASPITKQREINNFPCHAVAVVGMACHQNGDPNGDPEIGSQGKMCAQDLHHGFSSPEWLPDRR